MLPLPTEKKCWTQNLQARKLHLLNTPRTSPCFMRRIHIPWKSIVRRKFDKQKVRKPLRVLAVTKICDKYKREDILFFKCDIANIIQRRSNVCSVYEASIGPFVSPRLKLNNWYPISKCISPSKKIKMWNETDCKHHNDDSSLNADNGIDTQRMLPTDHNTQAMMKHTRHLSLT
jgi:hypothetical protein